MQIVTMILFYSHSHTFTLYTQAKEKFYREVLKNYFSNTMVGFDFEVCVWRVKVLNLLDLTSNSMKVKKTQRFVVFLLFSVIIIKSKKTPHDTG